jgi:hypothetical protein
MHASRHASMHNIHVMMMMVMVAMVVVVMPESTKCIALNRDKSKYDTDVSTLLV